MNSTQSNLTAHTTGPRKSISLRKHLLDKRENLAELIIADTFPTHQVHQLGQHVCIGHSLKRLMIFSVLRAGREDVFGWLKMGSPLANAVGDQYQ